MSTQIDFKNLNIAFLKQYVYNSSDENTIKIMKIVDNTIELIKDEDKFLLSTPPDVVEDKVGILSSVLLFLAELKDVISPTINYEELIHKYMIKCKEFIEQNINYLPMSLYGGLTDFELAIYAVNETTGNYNRIFKYNK